MVIRKYGTSSIQLINEGYQPGHLPYQEAKTEWGNRKRKVSWILPQKNRNSTTND